MIYIKEADFSFHNTKTKYRYKYLYFLKNLKKIRCFYDVTLNKAL